MRLDLDAIAEVLAATVKEATAPLLERIAALEARPLPTVVAGEKGEPGLQGPEGPTGRDGRDGLPGVPGPVGEKGADGRHGSDGIAGKDGAPGRDGTLENLKAVYDGERTLTLYYKDSGDPIEGGVIVFPIVLDRGVYQPDRTYTKGDGVTWAGSFYIAQDETSAKPGEANAAAWRLAVKRGADGREGKPGTNGKDGKPGQDGRSWH